MISRNSLSGAYPTARLGDVADFLDSMRRPVTESDRRAGQYPYYGANGLQGTMDGFIFDEPLVLLAEDGGHFNSPERGIAYRVSGKTWVNNHAHVLRPKECIDLGFLCRVLENYDVTPWVTGTTRGKLTQAGAAQIIVPLPPLPEQRRIAEVLDRAEALRAKRRAALAQLDTLTQSIFLDMFGDPATNPKGWPVTRLGDLCQAVIDCPHSTPVYSNQRTPYPCVRSSDIQDGSLDLRAAKYVDRFEYDRRIARGKPVRGDVIYCREGARFGNAARVVDDQPLCLGQRMMLLRPRQTEAVSEYIWAFLSSPAGYREAARSVDGSAAPHVNIREIIAFRLPAPPRGLQGDFAVRIEAVDQLKTIARASITHLDTLFFSLQHRAFRGEL